MLASLWLVCATLTTSSLAWVAPSRFSVRSIRPFVPRDVGASAKGGGEGDARERGFATLQARVSAMRAHEIEQTALHTRCERVGVNVIMFHQKGRGGEKNGRIHSIAIPGPKRAHIVLGFESGDDATAYARALFERKAAPEISVQEATLEELARFRETSEAAGFGEVRLQLIPRGAGLLPPGRAPPIPVDKADARILTTNRHRRRFDWAAPSPPPKVPPPSPPTGSLCPAAAHDANDAAAADRGRRAARAHVRADSRVGRRRRALNGTVHAAAAADDDDGSESATTHYSEAEMASLKARLNALIGSGGGGGGGDADRRV